MPLSHTHDHTPRRLHEGHDDDAESDEDDDTDQAHGDEGQLITYHFEQTPVMSSYLVAWAIGDLVNESMDCKAVDKTIKVAVWGTNDR